MTNKIKIAIFIALLSHQTLAIGQDKVKHAAISSALAITTAETAKTLGADPLTSTFVAFLVPNILGLAKELLLDPHADSNDLAANALGAALGAMIHVTIQY